MGWSDLYQPPYRQPTKAYRVMVTWHDGRITCAAESDNPIDLRGAPTVSRNARSIARIEISDRSGVLETVWASHWVGYQRADRPPAIAYVAKGIE